jgi:hypothetical protein
MTEQLLQKANNAKERLHKLTTAHYALVDLLNEPLPLMTGWKVKKLAGILDGLPHDVFEELLPEISKVIQRVIAAEIQITQKEFGEL